MISEELYDTDAEYSVLHQEYITCKNIKTEHACLNV